MQTITKFITSHNRPGNKIPVHGVVVHWTANENKGANAMANRNYFQNTDRSCSAHLCVDDTYLVECLPWRKGVAEEGWHVGANSYNKTTLSQLNTTRPNGCTIGLEICVNSDGDFNKAYANAVQVIAMMLQEHNLGIDKLYRHYDVTGKNCPAFFVDNGYAKKYLNTTPATAWANFRNAVAKAMGGGAVAQPQTGFYRTINFGAKGEDVAYLQESLIKLGYPLPKYGVDGAYGQAGGETVEAVRKFQTAKGLTADGICGTNTQTAIKKALADLAEKTGYYRVFIGSEQQGAFSVKDNAIEFAKDLADDTKKEVIVKDPTMKVILTIPAYVAPAPVTHMYRVRKDWADAKTQLGAFGNIDSAKALADSNAKDGYEVYDETGKVVYAPSVVVTQPIPTPQPEPTPAPQPTPEPQPQPIPVPVIDHTNHKPIMGDVAIAPEKMVAFVKEVNPNAQDIEEIAKQFVEIGKKYGVRGDIAFCQSIIETGYFKFDGGTAVTPDQHNYCGHGVTSKGMKGSSFATVQEGVTAQIQHLMAYACDKTIPEGETVVDNRFKYVSRGVAPHWEDLSNKWAMNEHYGTDIMNLYGKLLDYKYVPPVIIEPTPEPPVVTEPPVKEPTNNNEEEKLNFFKKLIDYLIEKLASIFKGGK